MVAWLAEPTVLEVIRNERVPCRSEIFTYGYEPSIDVLFESF